MANPQLIEILRNAEIRPGCGCDQCELEIYLVAGKIEGLYETTTT